jgi:hypothetical protein
MSSQLSATRDPEFLPEFAPEHEAADDLEGAHDDEPDAEQGG